MHLVWPCFAFWVCNAGLDWRTGSFLHGASARCFFDDLDDFSFHLGSRFLTCGVHARHVGYRFESVLPLVDCVVHPSKYISSHVPGATLLHLVIVRTVMSDRQMVAFAFFLDVVITRWHIPKNGPF